MVNPHEDNEQLDHAHEWWKKNGSAVIGGIVLGLIGVLGINYWQSYKTNQAEAASTLFDQMSQAFRNNNQESAVLTGEEMVSDYSNTPYAASASLYLAKIKAEEKDYAGAKQHLQWIVDNSSSASMVHTAKVRLAYLALAENQPEQVVSLLENADAGAFDPQYQELLGDAYNALGRNGEAATAYDKAMSGLTAGSSYASILQQKINKANAAAQ